MDDFSPRWTPFGGNDPTWMLQFLAMQRSIFSSAMLVTLVTACGLACGGGAPATEPEPAGPPMKVAPEAAPPASVQGEGPEGVVNYTRIDATVACAGATPPEAMAALKDLGFAAVINFRTAGERGATVNAGQAAAEAAGLKYHHIPFRQPTAEVAGRFLRDRGRPVEPAGLHPLWVRQPGLVRCG